MEEPGRLQPMGSKRVGHDWATSLHFTSKLLKKKKNLEKKPQTHGILKNMTPYNQWIIREIKLKILKIYIEKMNMGTEQSKNLSDTTKVVK